MSFIIIFPFKVCKKVVINAFLKIMISWQRYGWAALVGLRLVYIYAEHKLEDRYESYSADMMSEMSKNIETKRIDENMCIVDTASPSLETGHW